MAQIYDINNRKPRKAINNFHTNQNAVKYAQRQHQLDTQPKRKNTKKGNRKLKTLIGTAIFIGTMAMVGNSIYHKSEVKDTTKNYQTQGEGSIGYNEQIESYQESPRIVVDTKELNDLNVVLVNDGVSDGFYQDLQEQLQKKGIEHQSYHSSQDVLTLDGTETVISLLPYGGDKTKVIGQYEDRLNTADPLALGMAASFSEQPVTANLVQCGIHTNESSQELMASPIEKVVGTASSAFVSLAIPINTSAVDFSQELTEGLARYHDYLEKETDYNLFARMKGSNLTEFAQNHQLTLETIQEANQLYGSDANIVHYDQTILLKEIASSFDNQKDVVINQTYTTGKKL